MTSTQKLVWSIIGVIAVVLIGAGFYFSNQKTDVAPVVTETEIDETAPVTIDVKHQYINGIHTIAGSVDLPTPCHSLAATSTINATRTVATIALTSTSSASVCAQVISPNVFKTQFMGAVNMEKVGTFNGKAVNLNFFEVPTDENIDTFQIYTKG